MSVTITSADPCACCGAQCSFVCDTRAGTGAALTASGTISVTDPCSGSSSVLTFTISGTTFTGSLVVTLLTGGGGGSVVLTFPGDVTFNNQALACVPQQGVLGVYTQPVIFNLPTSIDAFIADLAFGIPKSITICVGLAMVSTGCPFQWLTNTEDFPLSLTPNSVGPANCSLFLNATLGSQTPNLDCSANYPALGPPPQPCQMEVLTFGLNAPGTFDFQALRVTATATGLIIGHSYNVAVAGSVGFNFVATLNTEVMEYILPFDIYTGFNFTLTLDDTCVVTDET